MKKKKCDNCGKEVRDIHVYKGNFLCYYCLRKRQTIITIGVKDIKMRNEIKKVLKGGKIWKELYK